MGILLKSGRLAVPSSPGIQDVTGIGFQPSFLYLIGNSQTGSGETTTKADLSVGVALSASSQIAYGLATEPGASPAAHSVRDTGACVRVINPDGTTRAAASFVSWLPDGFRLNWSAVQPGASVDFSAAKGFEDVEIIHFKSPLTTGIQYYPLSWPINLAIFLSTGSEEGDVISNQARLMVGGSSGSTPNRNPSYSCLAKDDGSVFSGFVSNGCLRFIGDDGTYKVRGIVSQFAGIPPALGINWAAVDSVERYFTAIVFNSGHGNIPAIMPPGVAESPTVGVKDYISTLSTPAFYLPLMSSIPAGAEGPVVSDLLRFSLAVADWDGNQAHRFFGREQNKVKMSNDQVIHLRIPKIDPGFIQGESEGVLVSKIPHGVRFNWTKVSGLEWRILEPLFFNLGIVGKAEALVDCVGTLGAVVPLTGKSEVPVDAVGILRVKYALKGSRGQVKIGQGSGGHGGFRLGTGSGGRGKVKT